MNEWTTDLPQAPGWWWICTWVTDRKYWFMFAVLLVERDGRFLMVRDKELVPVPEEGFYWQKADEPELPDVKQEGEDVYSDV